MRIIAGFIFGIIFCVTANSASAIGAQLENVSIKDLFFGLCTAGQISREGMSQINDADLDQADLLSDKMMKRRQGFKKQ